MARGGRAGRSAATAPAARWAFAIATVFAALLCVPPDGLADSVTSGDGCGKSTPPGYDVQRHVDNVHDAALNLLDYLSRNVQRAAVVARAGADLSENRFRNPKRQKYTHAGLVWKSPRDGLWRFRHVLNVCAGPSSELFVQSLVQFFDDDPHYYDVMVTVPSPELQAGIANILENEAASRRLHNPKYSNIANPFRTDFQNSNGWVLAVIAAVQSGLDSYPQVVAFVRRAGYVPSAVKVGFLRKLGAGFVANATVSDHPSRPFGGWYEFVSTASVRRYLASTDTGTSGLELCHPSGCNLPFGTLNGPPREQ